MSYLICSSEQNFLQILLKKRTCFKQQVRSPMFFLFDPGFAFFSHCRAWSQVKIERFALWAGYLGFKGIMPCYLPFFFKKKKRLNFFRTN